MFVGWISWCQNLLGSPGRWVPLDRLLRDLHQAIKRYNLRCQVGEEITSPAWVVLWTWWRFGDVTFCGRLKYRDVPYQTINAVPAERHHSKYYLFSDRTGLQHKLSKEIWYDVGVWVGPLPSSATILPGQLAEPQVQEPEPPAEPPPLGRPTSRTDAATGLDKIPDTVVKAARSLTSLFPEVRRQITGNPNEAPRGDTKHPNYGLGNRVLRKHLTEPFRERRARLKGEQTPE